MRIPPPPASAAPRRIAWLAALAASGGMGAWAAAGAPAVASAPAAATAATSTVAIDLDAFEARKKTFALSDGVVLAYLEIGDPAGRPVVLIHGYTDSARDWVPMLPFLPKRDRLILVDIRGHGRSSKPECCYSRLDFAYDIKLLLDSLGVDSADIVGHSLGSIIAQTFAEYWPQRTRRVVLISSTGGHRPSARVPRPAWEFADWVRGLKEPIEADSPSMIEWWSSPTPVDPEFIRREREDSAAIPLRVWLAVLDQGLPAAIDYADLQSTLPRLKAPTLLIWGAKDPIMDAGLRQTLRDALPAAKVKIFSGLGHNPFWEQPQKVADVIQEFLDAPAPAKTRP
jgi:pimeloyl-ACP methyl ester carboxylesterase